MIKARHYILTYTMLFLLGVFHAHPAVAGSKKEQGLPAINSLIPSLQPKHGSKNEYVVLIHGILVNSVQAIEAELENAGYDVIDINYQSTTDTIPNLITHVSAEINQQITDKTIKVNFVGYSLGGMMVRGAMNNLIQSKQLAPANIGRVVLIATPNQGCITSNAFSKNQAFKDIWGPAGVETTTQGVQAMQAQGILGPFSCNECGIIAGDDPDPPKEITGATVPNDGAIVVRPASW